MGCHQVRSLHHLRLRFFVKLGQHCTHRDFDFLGGHLTDFDVVLLAQIVLDVAGEHVTCGADAVLHHQSSKGDDGDFGGTSTYVHHHVALRGFDVKTDSEGCCHRLENQVHIPSSRMLGGVAHSTYFHFGTSRRDADNDLEIRGENLAALAADLADESANHHLGSVEVCDYSVFERTDRLYVGIVASVHQLGLTANSDAFPACNVQCDDTWLVQHYRTVLVDDGVGRSEIYSQFLAEE